MCGAPANAPAQWSGGHLRGFRLSLSTVVITYLAYQMIQAPPLEPYLQVSGITRQVFEMLCLGKWLAQSHSLSWPYL